MAAVLSLVVVGMTAPSTEKYEADYAYDYPIVTTMNMGGYCPCCEAYFSGQTHIHSETVQSESESIDNYPSSDEYPADFFRYTVIDGEVRIDGFMAYMSYLVDIVIPKTIDGMTVTAIAPKAIYNSYCRSIAVPETVTDIGDMAFGYDTQYPKEFYKNPGPNEGTNYCLGIPAIIDGFTIYGYKGSAAEEYARQTERILGYNLSFDFIDIGEGNFEIVSTTVNPPILDKYGDTNLDGKVTAGDVMPLLRHFIKSPVRTGKALENSDVTGDGKVNLQGLATLKQFSVGDAVPGGRLTGM